MSTGGSPDLGSIDVRATFERIRQHIKWDLEAIFTADHVGNFAAALLIAVGCEAVSRLLGKRTDHYLTELLCRRGLPAELAADVAEALRNGLAHIYDTRYVESGALRIELVISWGAKPHLSKRTEPLGLFLNVRTMAGDLRELFEELRFVVPDNVTVPAQWVKGSVNPVDSNHSSLWAEWIRKAPGG